MLLAFASAHAQTREDSLQGVLTQKNLPLEAKITKQFAVEAGVYNSLGSMAFEKSDYQSAINYFHPAIATSKVVSERGRYNQKMNKIYAALAIALSPAGLFLYYAYRQRSKSLTQTQKLHELELDKLKQAHRISMLSATLEGQEQERIRLARDLHDGLGGLLSAVKMDLSGLTTLVTAPKQSAIIGKTLHHLDTAVDELRRIAKSMMPEVLLTYGLGEATKEYCNSLQKSGIPVICQIFHYKNDMNANRQVTLYRIMQELVNNGVKHASATQILVQLQQSGNSIYLTVEDNGLGFDKVQMSQLKGAGLANIQSRVEMLQGKLEVESTPGTGASFSVECLIKK